MDLLAKRARYETNGTFRVEAIWWGFIRIRVLSFLHCSLFLVFYFRARRTTIPYTFLIVTKLIRVSRCTVSRCHLLTISMFIIGFIEVLEHICFLVRRVISNVLLDILNLLDQIELIFLRQVVQVKLDFFLLFGDHLLLLLLSGIWARPSTDNSMSWTCILSTISCWGFLIISICQLLIGLIIQTNQISQAYAETTFAFFAIGYFRILLNWESSNIGVNFGCF